MTAGPPARVLVTGADGFAGRAVTARLRAAGYDVVRAVRRAAPGGDAVAVGDLGAFAGWAPLLQGVDAVVHLAARVHQVNETAPDPVTEYRRINLDATRRLAQAAREAGVRRFVFASSIKVNGEGTEPGRPYRADDEPAPEGPYAVSKLEAERALAGVLAGSTTDFAVFRPPLMYGPGVRANFLRMMEVIDRGMPLPFGRVRNARSLLCVENFADAVRAAVEHPGRLDATFLVSDGPAVSTAELARAIGRALGRPARLLPVPPALMRIAASALGKGDAAARLLGSLEVDDAPTRAALGWAPPLTLDEGLAETARWYRGQKGAAA